MNDYMKIYKEWLENKELDIDLRKELENIDENEIMDRFYQDLSFGTAGLRGKMGAGTNRMNKYVIRRATRAFGEVILEEGEDFAKKGVAIAYDCRINSKEFAMETALVFASLGIKVYLFDSLRPTPELSYAVRYYNCAAGINLTASHNPKIYNGYKVYWQEGSQIKSNISDKVLEKIKGFDLFENIIKYTEEEAKEKGLIKIINQEVDEKFYEDTMKLSLRNDEEVDKNIKVVYTPLNGAGNIPVRTVLDRLGYKNVYVVKEQEEPDGTFPTIEYPNPEDHAAFEYSEKLAKEIGADIMIATDPDCDRLAVEIMQNGEVYAFNGNQIGILLVDYLIKTLKEKDAMPKNPAIVKSIVTGEMSSAIAEKNGVKMFSVLTGFKNICELPNIWDNTKEYKYIMGYEESIGYNFSDYLRDKDGVGSTVMLVEAAAYYKKQNKTLLDVLNDLYDEYGYYLDDTVSLVLDGIEGKERIDRMMVEYRKLYLNEVNNSKLVTITDYQEQIEKNVLTGESIKIDIEKTDAVKFLYEDGCWYTLRPSGTEPKIKLYMYTKSNSRKESQDKLDNMKKVVLDVLHSIK